MGVTVNSIGTRANVDICIGTCDSSPTKSPSPTPAPLTYVEVYEDECETAGYVTLTSADECLEAAEYLGKTITWGPHGGYTDVVTGCSIRFNSDLFFNNPGVCDPDAGIDGWTYTGCKCANWMPCICGQTSSPIGSPVQPPTGTPVQPPTGTPVQSPVDSPVQPPTGTPVQSPVQSPTDDSCADSSLKFKVKVNGKKKNKDCVWVGNDTSRCDAATERICASTCGRCDLCKDFQSKFKISTNKYKKCKWAAKKASRCGQTGVADACRKTCGVCQP